MNALILHNGDAVQVSVAEEFHAAKAAALADAREVTVVSDEFTESIGADSFRVLGELEKFVESSRKAVKAPVLNLGRKIDSLAESALSGLSEERNRIGRLLTVHRVEVQRKADEAERARKAELERLERARLDAEEAERNRLAEIERIAAEEKAAKETSEAAFTHAERATADAAAADAAKKLAESEAALAVQREATAKAEADRLKIQTSVVVAPPKPTAFVVKKRPRFEVLDIHQVYLHSPGLVRLEPNVAEINNVINSGVREIPGLRVWTEDVAEGRR